MSSIAAFVDGPFWYFSLTVFVIGVLWRLIGLLSMRGTRSSESPAALRPAAGMHSVLSRFVPVPGVQSRIRVRTVASYLFHIGLFLILIFAAPHITFYESTCSASAGRRCRSGCSSWCPRSPSSGSSCSGCTASCIR
jgi:nitrate reductase gamma subunit